MKKTMLMSLVAMMVVGQTGATLKTTVSKPAVQTSTAKAPAPAKKGLFNLGFFGL